MTSSGMYCCSFWCRVIFWNRSPLSEYSITMLNDNLIYDWFNRNDNLPQTTTWLINESLLIGADIGVLDTGKNADLVQGILLFLVGQFDHFDFLQSVDIVVRQPLDLVDRGISSFTWNETTGTLIIRISSISIFNAKKAFISKFKLSCCHQLKSISY